MLVGMCRHLPMAATRIRQLPISTCTTMTVLHARSVVQGPEHDLEHYILAQYSICREEHMVHRGVHTRRSCIITQDTADT